MSRSECFEAAASAEATAAAAITTSDDAMIFILIGTRQVF